MSTTAPVMPVRDEVDRVAAMITVTVYSTGPGCQRCRLTCQCLEQAGIRHTVVDVTLEANAAARVFLVEELGYTEAPVVVVDAEPEHHWCGFRPDLIDRLAAHRIPAS